MQNVNFIFAAGQDGNIKVWNIPKSEECDTFGPVEGKNYCVAHWQAHAEVIWELNHHPRDWLLLSSSADGTIKMWKTVE